MRPLALQRIPPLSNSEPRLAGEDESLGLGEDDDLVSEWHDGSLDAVLPEKPQHSVERHSFDISAPVAHSCGRRPPLYPSRAASGLLTG